MITKSLFLSLPVIVLYLISILPDAGAEPQIFEVSLNSTSTIKNSTYENSVLYRSETASGKKIAYYKSTFHSIKVSYEGIA
ncbi:MAG: hypothetical protein ACRD47_16740, partial [Nitrososphaeraceae archaeon]